MLSVTSTPKRRGSRPVSASRPSMQPRQVRLQQLARRQVDRHAQRRQPGALPGRCLFDGAAQHPVADGNDQAGLLGDRDETIRGDAPQRRVLPAQQGLDADDATLPEVDLRLVVQIKLLVAQRMAQRGLQRQPFGVVVVRRGGVDADLVAAQQLGLVQRGVGAAQQGVGAVAVGRRLGDAEAAGQVDLVPLDRHRPRDGLEQRLRRGDRRRHRSGHHDHELIAAAACHQIDAAHGGRDALCHLAQHGVADVGAEAVVDALEAVELQHQHRGLGAGLQGRAQELEEPLAVRQAGQLVELQQLLDAPFGGTPIAQVVDADMGEGLVAAGHQADGDIDRNLMTLVVAHAGLETQGSAFAHLAPALRPRACRRSACRCRAPAAAAAARASGPAAGRPLRWHRERRRRARPGTTRRWTVRRHGGSAASWRRARSRSLTSHADGISQATRPSAP